MNASSGTPTSTWARIGIAIGIGLTLADASVVTLALPEILFDLGTTVQGVAAVIGVYTLVLSISVLLAAALRKHFSARSVAAAGLVVFALAGVICGVSNEISILLVGRAIQALGAGFAIAGAFVLLRASSGGDDSGLQQGDGFKPDRLWVIAAVFGTAMGPALGGLLTELFDWRSIFYAQVPLGFIAAIACVLLPTSTPASPDAAPAGSLSPEGDEGYAGGAALPSGPHAPTVVVSSPAAGALPEDDKTLVGRSEPGTAATKVASEGVEADPAKRQAKPGAQEDPHSQHHVTPWVKEHFRHALALALVSAALTAVLFLLVLQLISGWSYSPITGALVVSVLPIAALLGSRYKASDQLRAFAGSALIGAGVLVLAFLPTAGIGWVILPQILAGVGMGMALPALSSELLPERGMRDAARLIALRHLGITAALAVLAPIAASQLDTTVNKVLNQEVAIVLEAPLSINSKLSVVAPGLAKFKPDDQMRGKLKSSLKEMRKKFAADPSERARFDTVAKQADDAVVLGVNNAFKTPFLITAALAFIAALISIPSGAAGRNLGLAIAVAGLVLAAGQIFAANSARPKEVKIANPCTADRGGAGSTGIDGFAQGIALKGLDTAACKFKSSREELALAIFDDDAAKKYSKKYKVDPQSISSVLGGLLGGGAAGNSGDLGGLIDQGADFFNKLFQ